MKLSYPSVGGVHHLYVPGYVLTGELRGEIGCRVRRKEDWKDGISMPLCLGI
jgi:hypothetical protein